MFDPIRVFSRLPPSRNGRMIETDPLLSPRSPPSTFPDPMDALTDPNGLLAVGGDLQPARLLLAYRHGIFPWYSEGEPILWWSPDPRAVLFPEHIRISRSLRKTLRQGRFRITRDRCFADVIRGCAAPRANQPGTWITERMQKAYIRLHELGHAHSVECWKEGALAGGLYGVALDEVFFAESMFSRVRDASKVALVALCQQNYRLIDCQFLTEHLARLGAMAISRERFLALLPGFNL
uniref:Leucyl/phenylalanyl-tRNA--protein transferase n=1 Tax=Candidatus Kentrum eta TaxID=2126337 RepID=A0A450VFM5_9GAMM|nr:MAG: leucyl/phenylalanyl-tRNA--protein transferase [Candidatus Kentron sp. H]VFK04081.1 MAG: leucyl/phenylalanyl-tRNA--protein transferase [Candidatus Kentron sp. H]VFK06730.1 MAG: leucyl/phenylalanyl-tRNA--protein transferase [Candidatus Kentron sp. H]